MIARQYWKATFALGPSGTAYSKVNPPGAATWDFTEPLLSADTALALLVVLLLGAAALWFQHVPHAAGERRWCRRSLFVGLTLFVAFVFPYVVWMRHIGPHRYSHVAALGTAIVVVGLLARATWSKGTLLPSSRLVILGLLPVLFVFIRIDREATRSIAKAHTLVQDWTSFICRDLKDEAEIETFFVVGFPRVVGRIGVTSNRQASFHFAVQRLIGRSMRSRRFHRDFLPKGMKPEDIPNTVAIYAVNRRGEIRRTHDARRLDPVGPESFDLAVLSMGTNRDQVLKSPHFLVEALRSETASYVQRHMWIVEHMYPANLHIVRNELRRMATPGAAGRVDGAEYGAFVEPMNLKRGIILAAGVDGHLPAALFRMLQSSALTGPTLVAAVGEDRAPASLQRLLRLAARGAETTVGPALDALATLNPSVDEVSLRRAVELEREGRKKARRRASAPQAIEILERAERDYQALGIHRPEVRLTRLRCRIALSPERDAGHLPSTATFPLAAELKFLRALQQGREPTGVRLEAGAIATDQLRAGTPLTAFVMVVNQGSQHLPGGLSPYAARSEYEWYESGSSELRCRHAALLPTGGVPAGQARRIFLEIPTPSRPGRYDLKVVLRAEGSLIAEMPRWIDVQVRE
jgi:hypothetical protein